MIDPTELPLVMIRRRDVHLATPNGPHADYIIGLDRCDTPEKLLAWVVHLSSKMWVTPQHINELVTNVSEFFGWPLYA